MRSSVLDNPSSHLTDLRPGETGLRLKDDPYYGKVDIGAAGGDESDDKMRDFERKEREKISTLPAHQQAAAEEKLGRDLAKKRKGKDGKRGGTDVTADDLNPAASRADLNVGLGYLEEQIDSGVHILDGDEQGRIEVLTGKRLQQRAANDKDATPREPEDVGEGVEGEAGAREASRGNAMEPPERDRDKTKAAKPGESAKS